MTSYPGISSNTNQPPLHATNPAAVPYTTAPHPMPMPSGPGDEKPPVDANGNPIMAGMPSNNHEYDAQKVKDNAYNGGDWDAKNIVAPPAQHQPYPLPVSSDPYNIPPSGPNGQYTVEDYQRMAQARLPRFPIEQYGRCPKDAGEHYVREVVSNSSLCLIFLIGWICPVCVTKQYKCRKCGQVF